MRGTPVLFDKLGGGLNSAAAPYEIERDQARDLLNVVGTTRGGVKKRDGSTVFNGAGLTTLAGLFAAKSKGLFVVSGNGKIQKMTAGGVVSDLKTGLSAGARWEFTESQVSGGQGPIFGVNGTNTPQQWDGAAGATSDWTASAGAVPNGKFIVSLGNRVWIAGVPGDPSGLYFCELLDPRNWPAANVVRFDPNDGGGITGLGVIGPYVVVFKRDKAWVVYNLDTGANRPLGQGVGCIAHRSITETPRGTVFLADDGLFVTDGSAIKKISDRIQPTLGLAAASQLANAAGIYHDHHFYLSYSVGGAAPDRTLDLDLQLDSWWLHTNICAHQWARLDVGSGVELFGGRSADVLRTFVPGGLLDAGAVFLGFWASSWQHFGQPSLRKRLRRVHFDGQGYIDVYTAQDFQSAEAFELTADLRGTDGLWETNNGSLWGVDDGSIYGGSGSVQEVEVFSPGVARVWSVKVGNLFAGSFELDSFTMALNWRKD